MHRGPNIRDAGDRATQARCLDRRVLPFRHTFVVEPHVTTTIAGQGSDGHLQALEVLARE